MIYENGRHLSFPFSIQIDGTTAQVGSLESHVKHELMQLLLTNLAERLNLPEFGGGVRRLVFENIDEATGGMTKAMLTQAISSWLGHRITLEDLIVLVDNERIEVDIKYRITGTEDSRVLRFQRSGG